MRASMDSGGPLGVPMANLARRALRAVAPLWLPTLRVLSTSSKYHVVNAKERADAVLRSKIREPREPGSRGERSVRQLRIGNMLQRALTTILDERLVEDDDLYPGGIALEIVDVEVSPCLRFATFRWATLVIGDIDPVKFVTPSKRPPAALGFQGAQHGPLDHLSPAMKALVARTDAMFVRNTHTIKNLIVPRIKMKVGGCVCKESGPLLIPCCVWT